MVTIGRILTLGCLGLLPAMVFAQDLTPRAYVVTPATRMRFMILIPLSLRFVGRACPRRCAASLLATSRGVWFAKVKIS